MRAPGEVRLALRRAAEPFAGVGTTWRTLAERACVGREAAYTTVRNMLRAGELVVLGYAPQPGVNRPMALVAPQPDAEANGSADGSAELARVVRGWADFR